MKKKCNQIGKLIGYERMRAGIIEDDLCKGLCSRSFLGRVEAGERDCEKILADALLQRAGVSADKFVYMINPEEQDWLLLRENLILAVESGDMKVAAPLMVRYRRKTEKRSRLHRQLLLLLQVILEWKNGGNKEEMQQKLKEAWRITVPDATMDEIRNPKAANPYLTLTELVLVMMRYRIMEEQGKTVQAAVGYEKLLRHMEQFTDEEDRVKLYPQIAYRLAGIRLKEDMVQPALEVAQKAIELLKVRGRLFYLRQLLEIVCEYGEMETAEKAELEEIITSLKWLYTQYGVNDEPWIWNIPFGMAEVELAGNLIKSRRKVLGLSQEKLSEDICSSVSLSRIECGKVAPKRECFAKLMERVGMTGSRFENVVQMEQPELMELAVRISVLLSHSKGEEAEPLIQELEKRVKNPDKFTKQYLLNVKAVALYCQKKISTEQYISMQEEALYLTLPNVSLEKLKMWNFSRQEVNIINTVSSASAKAGKEYEIESLLQMVRVQYEDKDFTLEHYVAGYELTMRNLGSVLGNLGKYEEAIIMADKGIKLGLCAGRGAVLSTTLYDRGWDMEQMWKKGKYEKKESLQYVKASYGLNLLFDMQLAKGFLREHIERLYTD